MILLTAQIPKLISPLKNHPIMGYHKFRNYRQYLQASRDGEWVDGDEYPMSLKSFSTIPKAKRGKPLACACYLFLDNVHMDIAFGFW